MKPSLRRQFVCTCLVITGCINASSQSIGVGTTTPHSSAALDISHASKGLLVPRMTSNAINSIANPAKGLLVYDTIVHQLKVNMGTQTAVNWQPITSKSAWNLNGNSAINAATQFLGTTDNKPLHFRVNNIVAGELSPGGNVFLGLLAGVNNNTGYSNIAMGSGALRNSTLSNTVAIGDSALFNLIAGNGTNINHGIMNTAIGSKALYLNSTGYWNTSLGFNTLYSNTVGWGNSAVGSRTLGANTTGEQNTAIGEDALMYNTSGNMNTAIGAASLYSNNGLFNTGVGGYTLNYNVGGSYNTAMGTSALFFTSNSSQNTAVGYGAGRYYDLGWNNTFLGANAGGGFSGIYNSIAIGQGVTATGNNTARIGNDDMVSIGGIVGWSTLSDGRFKTNITENVKGLDFVMKLRPVVYQLDIAALHKKRKAGNEENESAKKSITEQEQKIYTGFIAQEVEEAAKQTGYAFSGVDKPKNDNDVYGLRYAEFVVPLVKGMQEQQQIINELKKQNSELLLRIEKLENK
jgi:trimeric autotransporter adhesin